MKYFNCKLNLNHWGGDTAPVYASFIHKQNDDGTFQVYWHNKGQWSDPMKKIPDHIYDLFEEITEQEAFIEIL